MKSYNWNDIRKHALCVEKGHEFKRSARHWADLDSENKRGVMEFACKCGAKATVYSNHIEIDHGRPKSLEEKAAERAERKAKRGTQGTASAHQ